LRQRINRIAAIEKPQPVALHERDPRLTGRSLQLN